MAKRNSTPSNSVQTLREVVYSFEAHDDLHLRIHAIRTHVEVLATLAGTGDVESLSDGVLTTALIDVENRLRALEEHIQRQDPRSAAPAEKLAA